MHKMKSFDVILEARVVVMALDEREAIKVAAQLVRLHESMLVPTTVREAYPKAWQPKKEAPSSEQEKNLSLSDVGSQDPGIDDEGPF